MRLYLNATEVPTTPVGVALASQLAQIGTLDQQNMLLGQASAAVDAMCKRRLGAPGVTTVGTGGASAGSLALPLASTLGYDNRDEQAVQVGSGSTQEVVPILSVSMASPPVYPYAGIATLASPLQYNHSAGEAVVGCYQEVREVGSSSSDDLYAEALTQEAQIAQAHAPQIGGGSLNLSRVVFLRQYPVLQLIAMQGTYSYEQAYFNLNTIGTIINAHQGLLTMPLGTPIYEGSYTKTTYRAGYSVIPDEVKLMTAYLLADLLMVMFNPQGAVSVAEGKVRYAYSPKMSMWKEKAFEIAQDNGYIRKYL